MMQRRSFIQIGAMAAGMAGLNGFSGSLVSVVDIVFIGLVLGGTLVLPNAMRRWPGSLGWKESAAIASIACIAVINTPEVSQFIYFQF